MTLFDHAARQLCRVASALVVPPAEQPRLLEIFHHLSSSWGAREIADCPRWSGVTDDCSPYELSVAFSEEGPELRMLVEAQADPACPSGYWEAALGLSRVLEERYGASLARLDAVAPLFAPHGHVWFSALHGAVLWPRSEPLFKIYLNPAARGLHLARRVVEAALGRLGLASSWPAIAGQLGTDDHLQFLALDLAAGAEARVKIYVRHANASPGDLARKVAAVEPEHAAEVLPFLDAVFGRRLARLPRPAITMYTLTGEGGAPSTVTTHVACYPSGGLDRAITKRIAQYLESSGISPRPYRRAVAALNDGRVNDATGIHNYVSLQHQRGRPRITTYLCPRVYLRRLGPIGFDPVVAWPSPVGGVAAGPGELTPGRGL